MLAHSLILACSMLAAAGPDTVVVCPPHFLDALRPWVAHRTAQGHRIVYVSNEGSAEQIRAEIRRQAEAGRLKYVLLVGDAEPAAAYDPRIRARCVPAFLADAKVNVRWRSTPELATDNWYADLDDDAIPDVAIGRLPVDTPQELSLQIAKILAYETACRPGAWCQRINFVAGIGGFGPLIDPIVELATKKFLTDGIPAEYETSMTYGSWRSPFCPSPVQFHNATIDRFNEGCLFWIYIGHGYPYQLDRVRVPGRTYHILNTHDMYKLDSEQGTPIAIFLACYTGAYDQAYDCLAEEMLRAPGGPVAVLAGSRVTMPYGMAVLGSGLMDGYFRRAAPTLGEVVLHAKRQAAQDTPEGTDRKLLDLLARAISPDPQLLDEERREHIMLFNLLGDPLMSMYHPQPLKIDVPEKVLAGTYLEVRGSSPISGRCTVELICRRDHFRDEPPTRHRYDGSLNAQTAFNIVYRQANDRRWSEHQVDVDAGPFLTAIKIPREARGAGHVCVLVEDGSGRQYALGSIDVQIGSPKGDTQPAQASLQDDPVRAGSQGRVSDLHR